MRRLACEDLAAVYAVRRAVKLRLQGGPMKIKMKVIAGAQVALAATLIAHGAMAAGAVVASPDKSVLYWSLHKPDERTAINAAMSQCGGRFGGGCVLEKSFDHGCVAIARSNSHRHWGYAWREDAATAHDASIGACGNTGSRSCSIQTESCE